MKVLESAEAGMATGDALPLPRVDVVFLAYNKDAGEPSTKSLTLDSVCTVSLYELERHLRAKRTERASMGVAAYKHYRWYNAALVAELRTTGKGRPRPLLQAFHWYIETSRADAFRIEGQQYEAVSLVVGAEVEHWYCAGPGGRCASGSRARVTSCQCHLFELEVKPALKQPVRSSSRRRTSRTNMPPLERIGEEEA